MATLRRVIAVDLARVYAEETGTSLVTTLAWGDEVEVETVNSKFARVRVPRFQELPDGTIEPSFVTGYIRPPKSGKLSPAKCLAEKKDVGVLKVDFVDVQQGDAAVIETPGGKIVLVDGGDNQLFARYLASRYRGSSAASPKEIDLLLVTHGDADHFAGLTEIHESETNASPRKRFFIHPARVYHNGLVKRPTKNRKETELLGATRTVGGRLLVTGLESDLLAVDDAEMNEPFRRWKGALAAWRKRGAIRFRRIERDDDAEFSFLNDEGLFIEVLGPMPMKSGATTGLPFLGSPPKGPRVGHESLSLDTKGFGGKSASHTINGHSIVFRLVFGKFRFLFTGDLNDEAARTLTTDHNSGAVDLRAEVLKVPHHGSGDFSAAFLQAVAPVVSVVSSGDESARKEYIHPRATLVGALGRYSRVEEPLVFVTELVAFFNAEGWTDPERHVMKKSEVVLENGKAKIDPKARPTFFAFSRTAYGIVRCRTNGERLLVFTNSGQADLKEAYAYRMDAAGRPVPDPVTQG